MLQYVYETSTVDAYPFDICKRNISNAHTMHIQRNNIYAYIFLSMYIQPSPPPQHGPTFQLTYLQFIQATHVTVDARRGDPDHTHRSVLVQS